MEYLLSSVLLVLNMIDYERDLGVFVFFVAGAAIIAAMFYFVIKKTRNFFTACLMMLCFTWQISWRNIFGGETSELQLPWFYLVGAAIVIYAFINVKDCYRREKNALTLMMFVVLLMTSVLPLFFSVSKMEGLKEFIMIGFFVIIVFAAFMFSESMPAEHLVFVKRAFIWEVFITSVGILFQRFMYQSFGIAMFKMIVAPSYSGYQSGVYLLMEDHSCSTIMLGCAVFYILDMFSKKNWWYTGPALIVIIVGLSLTSRRTSVISLIIILALYMFFHYKGFAKKAALLGAFAGLVAIMIFYLSIVRPVDTLAQFFDSNGRFENYAGALKIIAHNPFGIGFDNEYLASLMPYGVAPHNTLLRWIAMGGFIYAVPLVAIIAYVVRTAYVKKLSAEYWILIYTLFASNFIPDILNARFFVIPCALVFLVKSGSRTADELSLDDKGLQSSMKPEIKVRV